jgi:murein DD-endopeptidase MepM/ murein hydrolase activator NlpD
LFRLHLIIISTALILLLGCSPSPKYRGGKRDREESGIKKAPTEERIREAPVTFRAPVRYFRRRRITSMFGVRRHPRHGTKEFHHGIDIKAKFGDDVLASAPGTVIFAGRQSGYGMVVIIDHGSRFCTVSAHLSSISVREGSRVAGGDVVGTVGRSGNATGTHLHFEIRIAGKSVDPLRYISIDSAR